MKRRALIAAVVCAAAAVHLGAQSVPLRQSAYLKASNPGMSDHFGEGGALPGHTGMGVAVSGDGNTIAVGAPHESSSARGINPPSPGGFGGTSGGQTDDSAYNAGAVYVFTRSGGRFTRQAYIKASNAGAGDHFGSYVALSGDGNTMAVAAHWESSAAAGVNGNQADNSLPQAGAVYIFTRSGTTWTQAYLKADASTNTGLGDQFGFSVALNANGNTLAVGVYDESGSGRTVNAPIDRMRGGSGAVYVFGRHGTTWTREAYLKTWNAEGGDSWGVSVAISDDGNTLAAGSLDEDCVCMGVVNAPSAVGSTDQKADLSTGAVGIFVRSGGTWNQQAYIKASNTGQEDWFGVRLALSGDGNTLAVGAPNEDSSAQGINGQQNDDSATEAGAVYVFTRSGAAWSQLAYVKGATTEAFDEFGGAVGLSRDGRTLVAGAKGEDSSARGVNGNPADNSLDEAGAAYVFTR